MKSPPHNELFKDFHGSGNLRAAAAPTMPGPSTYLPPQMTPGAGITPFMIPPWFMMPGAYPPPGNSGYPSPNKRDAPSSDGPAPEGLFAESYPDIEAFLNQLMEIHLRCKLDAFIAAFNTQDYYYINKIIDISVERLTGPDFNMSTGNADFLHREATKEVKCIDNKHARERKRACHHY